MKPDNASSRARSRLLAAAVLGFIALTVLSLSTIFHPPPAVAQTRVYQLASTNTLKGQDYFLIDVADATSATGFRTMRIRYDTLQALLMSGTNATSQTNTATNGFIYGTNLLSDAYLSNLFATNIWLVDNYISNWFATNVWSTNAAAPLYASNVVGLDSYMSNFWDGHLIQTNTYASNWYGTNLIQNITVTSNYVTWNTTEIYQDIARVGTLIVTNGGHVSVGDAINLYMTLTSNGLYFISIVVTNGMTNFALTPNQYLEADGNKKISSTLNGSGWTNLTGSNVVGAVPQATGASYGTNWTGLSSSNAFSGSFTGDITGATNASGGYGGYGTLYTVDSTNVVLDASGVIYGEINATNSLNFVHCTNGPGAISVTVYPSGADRMLTFPTNWFWLSTNGFTLSGSLWSCYATNGEVAFLSLRKRSSSSDQTNVVARLARSQR